MNEGIALYQADGTPVTGDVSDQVMLYDDGAANGAILPNGLDNKLIECGSAYRHLLNLPV